MTSSQLAAQVITSRLRHRSTRRGPTTGSPNPGEGEFGPVRPLTRQMPAMLNDHARRNEARELDAQVRVETAGFVTEFVAQAADDPARLGERDTGGLVCEGRVSGRVQRRGVLVADEETHGGEAAAGGLD